MEINSVKEIEGPFALYTQGWKKHFAYTMHDQLPR